MKLDSLTDLYHEQLHDLYSFEQQIIKALPEMAEVACSAQARFWEASGRNPCSLRAP